MDGLFLFLRSKCPAENIIDEFHALVHADDTLIISIDRRSFINKCNAMLQYFKQNRLNLNLSKSSYFIINPSIRDRKCSIKLTSANLPWCSCF